MKKSERLIRLLFLPSLAVIIWLSAFIGVFLKGSQMINGDGDLGRHITIGNYILNTSKIPSCLWRLYSLHKFKFFFSIIKLII